MSKEDYEYICEELRQKGILDKFIERLKLLTGGTVFNQPMFDFLYATYRINPTMFD